MLGTGANPAAQLGTVRARFDRAATVTVAARNLATWTRYSGSDPEVEQRVASGLGSIYAQPLSPTLVVRLGAAW